MPAQGGQQPPRATVPDPRRLVRRRRDHSPAVRAEDTRTGFILVSFEDMERPASGGVPEARSGVGELAPRSQPRPVWAELQPVDRAGVAGQDGDFLAALSVPEANGSVAAGRA